MEVHITDFGWSPVRRVRVWWVPPGDHRTNDVVDRKNSTEPRGSPDNAAHDDPFITLVRCFEMEHRTAPHEMFVREAPAMVVYRSRCARLPWSSEATLLQDLEGGIASSQNSRAESLNNPQGRRSWRRSQLLPTISLPLARLEGVGSVQGVLRSECDIRRTSRTACRYQNTCGIHGLDEGTNDDYAGR